MQNKLLIVVFFMGIVKKIWFYLLNYLNEPAFFFIDWNFRENKLISIWKLMIRVHSSKHDVDF